MILANELVVAFDATISVSLDLGFDPSSIVATASLNSVFFDVASQTVVVHKPAR